MVDEADGGGSPRGGGGVVRSYPHGTGGVPLVRGHVLPQTRSRLHIDSAAAAYVSIGLSMGTLSR